MGQRDFSGAHRDVELCFGLSAPICNRNLRAVTPAQDTIIRSCALFSGLPAPLIELALAKASLLHYEKTTEIMQQGTKCEGMYLVLSGHVGVSVIDELGHQSNLVRAGPGDIIGDLEAMTLRPNLATCRTEGEAQLLKWDAVGAEVFLDFPDLTRKIIGLSYDRLAIVNRVRSLEHSATVDRRIADCLLRMSVHNPVITHSQTYIAEAVGCSRQTANRVLGELREAGIISLRKTMIEVLDRKELNQFFRN